VADNTVYVDAAGLLPALAEIGDFALGAELARQWAFAAQVQTGNDDDEQTFLHADCLTGLYAGDLFFQVRGGDAELSLSPGDLDEAIISFLAFAHSDDDDASPFERTDAFRTGFLGDVTDCDALLDG
jgi:predicted metalloprotease